MRTLSGKVFAELVENGYRGLKKKYKEINDLNVFPVPDGDTGTNMASTMASGISEMENGSFDEIGEVASRLSSGMLLGARGNSGVIVSQFFAGIAEGLQGLRNANVAQFSSSLCGGTRKAYEAVVKPVEGTILTVARDGTNYVSDKLTTIRDFETLFEILIAQMKLSLKRTPELLPVLKEAGVIDSGGAGLLTIIESMGKQILGETIEDVDFTAASSLPNGDVSSFGEDSVLEFGYCTEFILQLLNSKNGPKDFNIEDLIKYFETIGDSLVAVRNGTLVKVHVHTKTPNLVLEYAQRWGEFVSVKIENMSIQHNETIKEDKTKKKAEIAVVAVAPSPEIGELFLKMGANAIVPGGQTMNPSTNDFIHCFEEVNAKKVLVFPNNSNVILTAKQAAEIEKDYEIIVIESCSVTQCYSSLSMMDLENQDIETNIAIINECVANVVTGQVVKAIRSSSNNGIEISENDYMGLCNGNLVIADPDCFSCVKKLIAETPELETKSSITVFYGKDADDNLKSQFRELIEDDYPLFDLVELDGNQNIYPLLIAIE